MRNYNYQSILSVCREFGANNWESLLFYPKSDLEMWLQTLKALPDEMKTDISRESKNIRSAIISITKAINYHVPRSVKDDNIIIAPYHVERHSKELTRDDIDRMYAAACKMIARDTQEKGNKVCLGKRELLITLPELHRRRSTAKRLYASLIPCDIFIDQVIADKDTKAVCEEMLRWKKKHTESKSILAKVENDENHTERQLKTAKNRELKHRNIISALSKLHEFIISIRQYEQARVSATL